MKYTESLVLPKWNFDGTTNENQFEGRGRENRKWYRSPRVQIARQI